MNAPTATDKAAKPKHQRMGVSEAMDLAAKAHQPSLSGRSLLPEFKPFTPAADTEPSEPTKPAAEGNRDIRTVLLELIDENPYAPREVYSPEVLRERAESLRANGQYEVIHIIPHPERPGRFMIADGWTRVTACRAHKVLDALAAQVHHDLSPLQAAWLGYNQNESREQHCDLDRAFFFDKMYAQGLTQSEIAKKTGISQTQLSFYTAFRKLPEETLQIIRLNPSRFPAYIAQNLAKVARKVSEDKASSLASIYSSNGQSVNWMINQCSLLLEKEPRSPQKQKVGKVFRYSNGVLRQKGAQFDLSIEIDEADQEEFNKALEALLSKFAKHAAPSEPATTEQE
jgi:ParB family chromosome partitioning protein